MKLEPEFYSGYNLSRGMPWKGLRESGNDTSVEHSEQYRRTEVP